MSLYVKHNDVWEEVYEVFVKEAGTWETATNVYIKDSDVWEPVLGGSGSQNYTTAGSNTFTVPAGIYTITATIYGAGGGGGGCHSSGDLWVGGGGGAGGYIDEQTYSVTPNEVLTIEVGEEGDWGSTYFVGWQVVNPARGQSGRSSSHGSDGGDSFIARSGTDIARAVGGEGGPCGLSAGFDSPRGSWNNGNSCVTAANGTPTGSSNTVAEKSASIGCYGYGYGGPQAGGSNGSGYGSGGTGGYYSAAGADGGVGRIELTW
tara:strand:+ start:136 stop:918 length:783 start_codon:yes stop_codon:yes gene_type:complete